MAGTLRTVVFCRTSTAFTTFVRSLSSAQAKPVKINKNMSFRPAFDSPIPEEQRPLAVIYGWLVAKSRHIHKYGDFYLGKGFDVLHVKIKPLQMLWPALTQEVTQQIADFTNERQTQPVLIHGFSVGAYLFGETLNKIVSKPDVYGNILDRIVGQVFDSPADYTEIPVGFSKAVTPVPQAQKILQKGLEKYLNVFYNQATRHYLASSNIVKENPMRAPALMLYSDVDVVSPAKFNTSVIDHWRSKGIDVYSQCFEGSPHVSHFHHYPVEYITQLNNFLKVIGLAKEEQGENKERITQNV